MNSVAYVLTTNLEIYTIKNHSQGGFKNTLSCITSFSFSDNSLLYYNLPLFFFIIAHFPFHFAKLSYETSPWLI